MSQYPQFPRDGGEVIPQGQPERLRGRAGPAEAEPPKTLIDIRVNGKILGQIDVTTLKAKAQFELERMVKATDMLTWLSRYAGVSPEDLPDVEYELGEMPIGALLELGQSIGAAIGEAASLSKAKPRP